jgi:hypothetical protein
VKYRRKGEPEIGLVISVNEDKQTFTPMHTVEITYDVLVNDEIISAYESMLEHVETTETE